MIGLISRQGGHMAGRKQTNRPRQPKMPVRRDRAWFERNVAEQKAELDKVPAHRQMKLKPRSGTEEAQKK